MTKPIRGANKEKGARLKAQGPEEKKPINHESTLRQAQDRQKLESTKEKLYVVSFSCFPNFVLS
jgi:hypothetical protein